MRVLLCLRFLSWSIFKVFFNASSHETGPTMRVAILTLPPHPHILTSLHILASVFSDSISLVYFVFYLGPSWLRTTALYITKGSYRPS